MKKEFLDYLYELRSVLQAEIDRLAIKQREPRDASQKESNNNDWDCELRMRRGEIQSCNRTIENYLKIHPFNQQK